MSDMPIYVVVYEYARGHPLYFQYGVKTMVACYKCDFADVQAIGATLNSSPDRPLMMEFFTREPDTNMLREQAKEWK